MTLYHRSRPLLSVFPQEHIPGALDALGDVFVLKVRGQRKLADIKSANAY
jgi:hypothetical protein